MNRRELFETSGAMMAMVAGAWVPQRAAAAEDQMKGHDHAAMLAEQAQAAPRRFSALVAPFQACTAAAAVCIDHCQGLLAKGDKAMAACLRAALDCDVTCNAVLKAAGLNSDFTPALARTAIDAMTACAHACKPHVDHHAECKSCYQACLAAIDAAKKLAA